MSLPSSPQEATEVGSKFYFTGIPCRNGHIDKRLTSSHHCYQCSRDKGREYHIGAGKERSRHRHRMKKYGLSKDSFDALFEAQSGVCRICGVPLVEGSTAGDGLAVDHNHETGETRALLCNNCNRGLGMFRDSPSLLLAAASYVTKHK